MAHQLFLEKEKRSFVSESSCFLCFGGDFVRLIQGSFEQSMSLRLLDAGARVAYLPQMTFRHIGVNESAYVLSGDLRPWDRSADDK